MQMNRETYTYIKADKQTDIDRQIKADKQIDR